MVPFHLILFCTVALLVLQRQALTLPLRMGSNLVAASNEGSNDISPDAYKATPSHCF